MSTPLILKAVELAATSAKFKKTHPTHGSLQAAGWWLQRKYDGCFGMAIVREYSASQMLSRTGEDYTASCRHILAELLEAVISVRGTGWHEVVFLGEVWHPAWGFPTISGKFRKQAPCPDLMFMANDLLPAGLVSRFGYSKRWEELAETLPHDDAPQVRTFHVPRETGDAWERALEWQGMGGYDGAILRDPEAPYTIGVARAGQIVKVKPTLSLDLRVIDVLPGEGKHEGRAGALRCDLGGGAFVDVGTGLSDAEREEFWVCREGMLAPNTTIVEVEAMGWSTEGKLREPRLKGIRHDKLVPDR